MRAGGWITAAFGAVVVGATAAYLLSEPLLRPGDRVAVIGDSLAVGLGEMAVYGSKSALGHELKERDCSLVALGVGATTTLQWSGTGHLNQGKLLPVLRQGCRAVVVILGTNDCHYGYGHCPPFEQRIAEIAAEIKDHGAVPVLVAMPAMPWEQKSDGAARMQYARTAMAKAAEATGGIYVEPPSFEVARWPDGIHPNQKGARDWARYIMDVLSRARRWK